MKKAIQKAIEGGYKGRFFSQKDMEGNDLYGVLVGEDWFDQYFICSDPLFWQAYVRADAKKIFWIKLWNKLSIGAKELAIKDEAMDLNYRLIEHLHLENGNIESFFEKLPK